MYKSFKYEELEVGQKASIDKLITDEVVMAFAAVTEDHNPIHVDDEFAKNSIFKERIAHGMLLAGLFSAVLGTHLPGVNTIYLKQTMEFLAPVRLGDIITAEVEVAEKMEKQKVRLFTTARNQKGEMVAKGEALIKKPF
ncbi:MAG: MaoC family dehydratase [Clostridia bacterium]|jgi:3-hydroxybutyryl-CoA dehydratase|nr:MaoC family dehydratase [Clostridia bacterium]